MGGKTVFRGAKRRTVGINLPRTLLNCQLCQVFRTTVLQIRITKPAFIIKKRILIITAWYHPFIHPRAHRWTALAEYWAKQGHEIHVVCARRKEYPREYEESGVHIHRVGFDSLKELVYFGLNSTNGRGRVGAGVQRPGLIGRLAAWLYSHIWKNIFFPDDACLWYFPARKKVRELLEHRNFDTVISVSLPFTGHLIGLKAKKYAPSGFWIADIGDPFTIQARPLNNSWLYGRWSKRLERIVLEKADSIAVTTPAAIRVYETHFDIPPGVFTVIPPLFHPAPGLVAPDEVRFNTSVQQGIPDDTLLHIGYFGALYSPVRTPDAFLDLVRQTFLLDPGLAQRFRVHFFGEVFPEFWEKLHRQPAIRLYGLRSRQETQLAIQQMDILLHIGNSTDYQFPSKAVEYLASGKPVVHLTFVQNDPFVEFWNGHPGLLVLQVENGRVKSEEFQRWVAFLNETHVSLPAEIIRQRVAPFTIGVIAAAYLNLQERLSTR